MRHIKSYKEALNEEISRETQDSLDDRLINAARHGDIKFAKHMLDSGANANAIDVNVIDVYEQSPLHWAVMTYRNVEMTKLLLRHGANPNARDSEDETPLHFVVRVRDAAKNPVAVIKLLLKSGADIDAISTSGQTPLYWAIVARNTDAAEFLLNQGANPNIGDSKGETPLYWALRKGLKDTAKLLILRGADSADLVNAFNNVDQILNFFDGNISWMPEDVKRRIELTKRSKKMFGV